MSIYAADPKEEPIDMKDLKSAVGKLAYHRCLPWANDAPEGLSGYRVD